MYIYILQRESETPRYHCQWHDSKQRVCVL